MDTKTFIPVLVALIIGGLGGYMLAGQPEPDHSAMSMEDMMAVMNAELEGKDGDAFDRAFLTEMIAHHQGAVEMAQLALQKAGHEELKKMAEEIISAQNAEIKQMQDWQAAWFGRGPAMTEEVMHHAG
jgi:uncharacterized protein (DUF305 family)